MFPFNFEWVWDMSYTHSKLNGNIAILLKIHTNKQTIANVRNRAA